MADIDGPPEVVPATIGGVEARSNASRESGTITTKLRLIHNEVPGGGTMRRKPSGSRPRIVTAAPLDSWVCTVYLLSLSDDPARTRTLSPLTTPVLSSAVSTKSPEIRLWVLGGGTISGGPSTSVMRAKRCDCLPGVGFESFRRYQSKVGPASDADYSVADCSVFCSLSSFGVAGIMTVSPTEMKFGDKRAAADVLGRSRR